MGWGRRVGLWLIVAVGFVLLLRYDVVLTRWRYELGQPAAHGWGRQALIGLRDFGQVVPFVVAMVIIAAYDRRRKTIITTMILAEVLTAGGYNTGKWMIGRQRPCLLLEQEVDLRSLTMSETWLGWQPGNDEYEHQSFPSGHSAAAFTFAATLAWFYPRLRWMFWILAVGCAGSRYVDAVHWPSDCLAGAVIGYVAARIALWVCAGKPLARTFHHV